MLSNLYNTDILTLAASLRNETLMSPCGSARKVSKLCGSEVEIDLNMRAGRVTECALRVQACALGQASAALLKINIVGADLIEIQTARDALKDILKEGGDAPIGRFSDIGMLASVAQYPARHQSVMLAFDAAVDAAQACAEYS